MQSNTTDAAQPAATDEEIEDLSKLLTITERACFGCASLGFMDGYGNGQARIPISWHNLKAKFVGSLT